MRNPYFVGSDGENCWIYSGGEGSETFRTADFEKIQEKNLTFCDPFLLREREPAEAIEALNLEYLGTAGLEGSVCHMIRSWWVETSVFGTSGVVYVWWIDGHSYMVRRIEIDSWLNRGIRRFYYDKVNEEIDISEFRPDVAKGVKPQGLIPLEKGIEGLEEIELDRWFLSISDGSNSEMCERWGRKGEGIKASSGYNHFQKR